MDSLTVAAASGMRARMESLEMLANNLANQASPGFKMDREFYSLWAAPDAWEGRTDPEPSTAPLIERHWTDFSQGTLSETGNPYHVALNGPGFLSVDGPDGRLYTRNGAFRVSAAGRLETQEGYAVVDTAGRPITLRQDRDLEIDASGQLRQDGTVVARLAITDFVQPESLTKRAGTYFAGGGEEKPAGAVTVHQGRLESSNHPPAESAVRLITVLRQFEMLQKAIVIGGEMGRRLDDVARVGQ